MADMVAFGNRLGTGGAGDIDRGVDAGTGVLGGIGVFAGSAIVATWGNKTSLELKKLGSEQVMRLVGQSRQCLYEETRKIAFKRRARSR
jgi:hypothetical protein